MRHGFVARIGSATQLWLEHERGSLQEIVQGALEFADANLGCLDLSVRQETANCLACHLVLCSSV